MHNPVRLFSNQSHSICFTSVIKHVLSKTGWTVPLPAARGREEHLFKRPVSWCAPPSAVTRILSLVRYALWAGL